MSTPFTMPAICNPPTQSADVTDLPDDEPVIGVTVGEHSRAYVCRAMSLIHTHVINDLIEDTNIAVTFCDRTTTARVFCGPDDKGSIRMQVGGESSGAMVVNLNGVMHLQTSSRIPLQDLDFTETTWGQWKRLHPDTSVFTGQ
ncbi:MAG: DUF3179 domain-containing protein [Planctomycetaceae bacterium]|nr:DUF3179 domain-containing protein [Planctomycetaceae bacterium]